MPSFDLTVLVLVFGPELQLVTKKKKKTEKRLPIQAAKMSLFCKVAGINQV